MIVFTIELIFPNNERCAFCAFDAGPVYGDLMLYTCSFPFRTR